MSRNIRRDLTPVAENLEGRELMFSFGATGAAAIGGSWSTGQRRRLSSPRPLPPS